ncbi:unnamed protein product [Microthlaspi erraticum]|uniref:BHLH domain-containing protein n=1 Tax=Microthlaspi erraticum TaxID=1685480 RepID=A0A6D2KE76_9BRAS|nr:unnamed protein product [Microthlaspi erraticum]
MEARRFSSRFSHERRCLVIERYHELRMLIPVPSKGVDRATVLQDGIDYINELRRRTSELKHLVERKKSGVRHKNNNEDVTRKIRHPFVKMTLDSNDDENMEKKPGSDVTIKNSLRKSKGTEVYVSIVDDVVTIKVVQKKKINCLLFVSKVLDQLHLDLCHVTGGKFGEHYRFLLKTKVSDG